MKLLKKHAPSWKFDDHYFCQDVAPLPWMGQFEIGVATKPVKFELGATGAGA